MLKIAICDDQVIYIEQIVQLIAIEAETAEGYQVTEFTSGEALVAAYIGGGRFDLIFLDVEMGALSGLAAAEKIRAYDKKVMIVFVSAYGQYMVDAFDVKAETYLTKPIDAHKFGRVVQNCLAQYRAANQEMLLSIRNDRGELEIVCVKYTDIVYISNYQKWLTVYMANHTSYRIKGKIAELAKQLQPWGFVQTHSGHLINIRYLTHIKKSGATFSAELVYGASGETASIPVSRKHYKPLRIAFSDYKLRGVIGHELQDFD